MLEHKQILIFFFRQKDIISLEQIQIIDFKMKWNIASHSGISYKYFVGLFS